MSVEIICAPSHLIEEDLFPPPFSIVCTWTSSTGQGTHGLVNDLFCVVESSIHWQMSFDTVWNNIQADIPHKVFQYTCRCWECMLTAHSNQRAIVMIWYHKHCCSSMEATWPSCMMEVLEEIGSGSMHLPDWPGCSVSTGKAVEGTICGWRFVE